jgi:hypothetical protein
MKVLVTAASAVAVDIRSVVSVQSREHFLSVVDGELQSSASCPTLSLLLFRYSILPALSLDGILHCEIIEGAFKTVTFNNFISNLLDKMQPFPAENSVIVMDNCRIHKSDILREMVEER